MEQLPETFYMYKNLSGRIRSLFENHKFRANFVALLSVTRSKMKW